MQFSALLTQKVELASWPGISSKSRAAPSCMGTGKLAYVRAVQIEDVALDLIGSSKILVPHIGQHCLRHAPPQACTAGNRSTRAGAAPVQEAFAFHRIPELRVRWLYRPSPKETLQNVPMRESNRTNEANAVRHGALYFCTKFNVS